MTVEPRPHTQLPTTATGQPSSYPDFRLDATTGIIRSVAAFHPSPYADNDPVRIQVITNSQYSTGTSVATERTMFYTTAPAEMNWYPNSDDVTPVVISPGPRRLVDHGLRGNKLVRAQMWTGLRFLVGEVDSGYEIPNPPLHIPLKQRAWQTCVRRGTC